MNTLIGIGIPLLFITVYVLYNSLTESHNQAYIKKFVGGVFEFSFNDQTYTGSISAIDYDASCKVINVAIVLAQSSLGYVSSVPTDFLIDCVNGKLTKDQDELIVVTPGYIVGLGQTFVLRTSTTGKT
jgi:hypothetical protein